MHWRIHNGLAFKFFIDLGELLAAATYLISIETGDQEMHAKELSAWTDGPHIEMSFYEDSSDIVGGSAVPIQNLNRKSANASDAVVTKDLTSITAGTLLDTVPFGGGGATPAASSGGSVQSELEWELKANSIYHIAIFNEGADADVHFSSVFYIEGLV